MRSASTSRGDLGLVDETARFVQVKLEARAEELAGVPPPDPPHAPAERAHVSSPADAHAPAESTSVTPAQAPTGRPHPAAPVTAPGADYEPLLRVLLVGTGAGQARALRDELEIGGGRRFEFSEVARIGEAIEQLAAEQYDAIVLDLEPSGSAALDVVTRVTNTAAALPIVALCGPEDEELAVGAVRLGAQEVLAGARGGRALSRAIRCAIERKRSEESLRHVADHDPLTNLPNRRRLLDRLHQGVARARRAQAMLGLLLLDLDHFKTINESLGPTAGDLLLREIAGRLSACTRESDTVARLGGDEFALVLPDLARVEDASLFAEKIREVLRSPLLVAGRELLVSASIGIAIYPFDEENAEGLIQRAEAAMDRAKSQGRNTVQFCSPAISVVDSERPVLGAALRHALERGEMYLNYQPQVHLGTRTIVGVEALIRWRHEDFGLIPPAKFIPLAEENGLIVSIGSWALEQACEQARLWQQEGLPPIRVAVNISSRQLDRAGLVATVVSALRDTGLSARMLDLEITESGIMKNEKEAVATLRQLKATGLHLTIDDFGTGYSSLSQLRKFPLDALKIDQSFVRGMTSDPHDAAIVKAIIAMAHGLRMEVVAEGVETARQEAFLRKHGCDRVQGYMFWHPLAPEEIEELLRAGNAPSHG